MDAADTGPARRLAVLKAKLKAGLVVLTVTAWIYVCLEAFGAGPSPMAGAHHAAHSASLVIWGTLTMWMVMMVAMMVPAVFPWVFTLARLERGSSPGTGNRMTAPAFLAGYFTAWLLFAVSATTLQWYLSKASLLSPSLIIENDLVRGVTFMILGAYQWSPLKDSCLTHCQSPFTFFLSRWRDGWSGAFVMGAHHGLYCVGCCWLVMAGMVVVGAMSFPWMVGFTLFMLMEMYVPELRWSSRVAGAMLIVAGIASVAIAL